MGFEIIKITDSKGRRFTSLADAIESDVKAIASAEAVKLKRTPRAQVGGPNLRQPSVARHQPGRTPGPQFKPHRQSAGARAAAAVRAAEGNDKES